MYCCCCFFVSCFRFYFTFLFRCVDKKLFRMYVQCNGKKEAVIHQNGWEWEININEQQSVYFTVAFDAFQAIRLFCLGFRLICSVFFLNRLYTECTVIHVHSGYFVAFSILFLYFCFYFCFRVFDSNKQTAERFLSKMLLHDNLRVRNGEKLNWND